MITVRSYPFESVQKLVAQGISPVMARIYAARGITDQRELKTDLTDLIPPDQLLNNDQAARLLADAIQSHQRICIVADYDCDGATACAVGLLALKMMGANVSYYVPNRFHQGYGLSPEIVQAVKDQTDLIVTVDNGIASLEGVKKAQEAGLSVLITDHHLPGDKLPDCVIVNPNQPNCPFPSKNIAGVGVIFYVMLMLRAELRTRGIFDKNTQPNLAQLLDLVALGTVADLVKLDQNNRILVAQGLKRMRSDQMHPGIAALFRAAHQPNPPSTTDLAFLIAPRLNAAGRLSDMTLGVECLTTEDQGVAWEMASQLDAMNQERRNIEQHMKSEALAQLIDFEPKDTVTISLYNPNWHQGIIGILASRLKDQYFRPVIVCADDQNGFIRGSGRSIAGFHLRDALDIVSKRHPDMMQRFGGHAMAAGLTLNPGMFEAFQEAFETVAKELLGLVSFSRHIETDGAPDEYCYTTHFVETLRTHIWGQGFEAPVFSDTFHIVRQRVLKNKHLSMQLSKNGVMHNAIYFNHNTLLPEDILMAFRLENNVYNGVNSVQLIVEHIE